MKESTKRHLVPCEHCSKDVLDHMTECPFCGGKLTPRGYSGLGGEKSESYNRIRKISRIFFFVLAGICVIWMILERVL